ncbi:Transposase, IS4-like domain protein [Candidatus Magnetobacterium bavaricum]|uniref:Transposase, IS4-like domain protein n=1 Tax=Candidatus Magnetobacterium bavaricum TaxID=29290 RepID=A0A0F3GRH5_9BACT|nr:Transposase, IS4-like domain protein [Candidatus Magnetobacterium bavaricum]
MIDKETGGYIIGQNIVFIVLVTPKITIPVGFEFYVPDPEMTKWYKEEKRLKEQGVDKKDRPYRPSKNEEYPTKQEIALLLLERFKTFHPDIKIRCIVADALYGTRDFLNNASKMFGGIQVISQLRVNQKIRVIKSEQSVAEYFLKHPPIKGKIRIRGSIDKSVMLGSVRAEVCSHGVKRFVIALKYDGEEKYRYLVASNLSWRALDIVQAYTLRWLIEIVFQDWKAYEGWGQLTKQPGEDGSYRSLILSLLVDHSLFFHPNQITQIDNCLPAYTVGSLQSKIKVECLISSIKEIVLSENPKERLNELIASLEKDFVLRFSRKHMVGKDLGRIEPTPSLKYKSLNYKAA